MRKKLVAALLCGVMGITLVAGSAVTARAADSVELNVVTTFAGEDSNAKNYQEGLEGWQEATGNTVNDNSATSDETFKTTVVSDFEMDAEPDVLFFFTGADANSVALMLWSGVRSVRNILIMRQIWMMQKSRRLW